MKKAKPILSVFLSFCMIISCMVGMSVTASATDYYYFWVGGIQVTSDNASNIDGEGKASFDPHTCILTLNNYSYEGNGTSPYYYNFYSAIDWMYWIPLTIVLNGDNNIKCTASNDYCSGITSWGGNIVIQGDGSLYCEGGTASVASFGLYMEQSGYDLEINSNANATFKGGTGNNSYGLYLKGGNVNIENSTVQLIAGSAPSYGYGALVLGDITVNNSEVTAKGAAQGDPDYSYGIYAYGLTVDDSTLTAEGYEASQSSTGIRVAYNNLVVNSGEVTAIGGDSGASYGINANNPVTINGGEVYAAGETNAIKGTLVNSIDGSGWTDSAGTEGQAVIEVSTEGQTLEYKNVQFPGLTYSVTYRTNGGHGTAPVDETEYKYTEEVTVSGAGELTNTGYTFAGWNTKADGSGTAYAEGDTFAITEDITLYAQWTANQYTIRFDTNGGSNIAPITQDYGTDIIAPADPIPASNDVVFAGWVPVIPATMPANDLTVKAVWKDAHPNYVPANTTPTVPTVVPTTPAVTPSTPAATSSVKMRAVQNADKSSITVSWDKVSGATKYTLYVRKNGKLEKVVETKKTKVLIKNVATNTDLEYVLKYTINGVESAENSAYTASIKVNYKPAAKLTASKGSIMVKWSKVPEATKYRVYKYANGKLTLITETAKSAVRVTGTKAGSKYSYAVKALVNGEWTKIYSSDIATVTAK